LPIAAVDVVAARMNDILLLSFVTGSISFTVSEAKLFKPLREWFKSKNRFLGELFSCGYCLGHWVAFVLVAIYQPRLFQAWWLLDYFLTALIISWMGALQWIVMCLLFARAGK
jgi:hypothetical protein